MAMFRPSQSHSGDFTVNPYIAQELQFLTEEKKNPILILDCRRQPSSYFKRAVSSFLRIFEFNILGVLIALIGSK